MLQICFVFQRGWSYMPAETKIGNETGHRTTMYCTVLYCAALRRAEAWLANTTNTTETLQQT